MSSISSSEKLDLELHFELRGSRAGAHFELHFELEPDRFPSVRPMVWSVFTGFPLRPPLRLCTDFAPPPAVAKMPTAPAQRCANVANENKWTYDENRVLLGAIEQFSNGKIV